VSLSFQIGEALDAVDLVLAESAPDNVQEAQAYGSLAVNAEQLMILESSPPSISSGWSLVPALGLLNLGCPGGNCLELIDAPASLYKEQCLSGLLSTINPCSEYIEEVYSLMEQIGAQLRALGYASAAEILESASAGAQNIQQTSENVTQPTLGDLWKDSPNWIKVGAAAALALLVIRIAK